MRIVAQSTGEIAKACNLSPASARIMNRVAGQDPASCSELEISSESTLGARILEMPEDVLLVRRHDGNMTAGKSLVEVNTLQVFKRIRDLQNRRKV